MNAILGVRAPRRLRLLPAGVAALVLGCGGDSGPLVPADVNGSWDIYMTPDGQPEGYAGVMGLAQTGTSVRETTPDPGTITIWGSRMTYYGEDDLGGFPITITMVGDDGIEREPQRSRPLAWTARVRQVRIDHGVAPSIAMEPGKVARIG